MALDQAPHDHIRPTQATKSRLFNGNMEVDKIKKKKKTCKMVRYKYKLFVSYFMLHFIFYQLQLTIYLFNFPYNIAKV